MVSPLHFQRPELLLLALPILLLAAIRVRRRRGLGGSWHLWRLASIMLLIAALAGPLWVGRASGASTVFVLDRSASVTPELGRADDFLNSALSSASTAQAAVVAFGSTAEVVAGVGPAQAAAAALERDNPIGGEASDLSSALALARSLPAPGGRRIVVLSDGSATGSDPLTEAAEAARTGTPIDVVPLEDAARDDLRVDSVIAPRNVWAGDPVDLLAGIWSPEPGTATVQVRIDGQNYQSISTDLQRGDNTLRFQLTELSGGFHAVEVLVVSPEIDDPLPENDRYPAAIVIRDHPSALLVTEAPADGAALRTALEERGVEITVALPTEVPSRLSDLLPYDAVLLVDVPAPLLSLDQVKALQAFARSLGRGVVVVGGDRAYGAGAYTDSPLEEMLPVRSHMSDVPEHHTVAIVLVIDKSASMSYNPGTGAPKIDMAIEAGMLATSALQAGDEVGVLAFNDDREWVVRRTTLTGPADVQAVNDRIRQLTSDGGTAIFPAVSEAYRELRMSQADVKHIILLSDGRARGETLQLYDGLINQLQGDDVSLSTIAIGHDADTVLLRHLADSNGGRYHFAAKPEEVPRLTIAEAQSVSQRPILQGVFHAVQALPSPIMSTTPPDALPEIYGFAVTDQKPEAQVVLTTDTGDPLLAKWQYGLGRVVAWTSDAGGPDTSRWTTWPDFDRFWFNVLRWALPDPNNRPLTAQATRRGSDALIKFLYPGDDTALASTPLTAVLTLPSGEQRPLAVQKSGPGEYEATVTDLPAGAYQISLSQDQDGGRLAETAGIAIPYPSEYRPHRDGADVLRRMAEMTGGEELTDPAKAFKPQAEGGGAVRLHPIWHIPIIGALGSFLIELALRLGVPFASLNPRRRRRSQPPA